MTQGGRQSHQYRFQGERRTLEQYIEDVVAMQEAGIHPERYEERVRILEFWRHHVLAGTVSLSDSVPEAIRKVRNSVRRYMAGEV